MAFADDPQSVPDDTVLLRILVDHQWWYPRENPTRPSSLAFFDNVEEGRRENSCFILAEADLKELQRRVRGRFPAARFATITAGKAREFSYLVCRDDEGGAGMPGHVVVCYPTDAPLPQYKKDAQRLAKSGSMFSPPAEYIL